MISQAENPSGDDPLLDQIIAEYLRAESMGQAGDRQQWLERYPDCAGCLAAFFDDRDRIGHLMMPVRICPQLTLSREGATSVYTPPQPLEAGNTVELRSEPPRLSSTRYRPLSFHARGGMGEIWLAEDERIGRRVAVKKLRAGRESQQARFFIEAQITGQLEHPSVVPLHDIGLDDAGQPFYVMKYIHGRRLKDAIAEFHAQTNSADWSDNVMFRRLLETFVSICNVVAYAHHKGVVHRDIKPDNVMLGPYGETLVVDWGLAKVIGQVEEGCDSAVRLSGNGSTATQDGAIVGSPYYMSPEGAKGHPEAVDQSSDVYLLGATLYEILTARPPRQGSSNWELIDLALHSRPTSPRKIDSRIPRPLDAICLKAMAFRKEDRYTTPLELVEDMERFLAGAPTTAFKEPLSMRCVRWIRKHRRDIARGLTAACVLTLGILALGSYRQAQTLTDREDARQQLNEFHRLADEAQFFAANTDAISERVPYFAASHAQLAGEAALAIAAPWGEEARQLPLPSDRTELLSSQYALLLLMVQCKLQDSHSESAVRQALALLEQAKDIHTPSRGYYQLRSQCFSLLGDVRAAEAEQNCANAPDTTVTPQDHFLAGELLRLQDISLSAQALGNDQTHVRREHLTAALEEYRQALNADPRHYWARFQLGRCLLAVGRGPEAIEALSACVALRPTSPWAYSTRGLANAISGRRTEASRDLDEAIRLDPDFQPARLNRGVVHWLQHQYVDALDDFNAALAAPDDKRLIEAAFYRGQILLDQNRDSEALADFCTVVAARPNFQPAYWYRALSRFRLGEYDVGRIDVEQLLALDQHRTKSDEPAEQHLLMGKSFRKLGQQMAGIERTKLLFAAASELQAAINAGPPTVEMWTQLGAVQELCGQNLDAVSAYSHGLTIDAEDVQLRNLRAWAYVNQKQYDLAQADFAESLRIAPSDAESHAGLGFVLAELGHDESAHREVSAALLAGADNHLILHNVACIFGRLSASQAENKTELEDLALAALERAVSVSRQNPIGPDADERTLIRNELSFPASLQSRPEFQRLLSVEVGIP